MAKGAVLEFDGDAPDADDISANVACDAAKGNERTQPYELVWIFCNRSFMGGAGFPAGLPRQDLDAAYAALRRIVAWPRPKRGGLCMRGGGRIAALRGEPAPLCLYE